MITLSLAVRNLLRNRRRSLATLLAIAIGSSSILLFGGYSSNIKYSMETSYVRSGGHLQIQHRDFYLYGSGNPTAYGIDEYKLILDAILTDDILRKVILVATPSLQFGGIAGNYAAGVSRTIIGNGFVASDYSRMRRWNGYDISHSLPLFALDGSAPDASIVGTGLARVLQLCGELKVPHCPQQEKPVRADGNKLPDDIAELSLQERLSTSAPKTANQRRIELLASNAKGTPNVASLEVIRAEGQGFKELDEVYVILHLDQTQRLIYGNAPPKVTSIMLQLRDSDMVEIAKERVAVLLSSVSSNQPLAVLGFGTLNPFYTQTILLFDMIFSFIFTLIGGIVLFTVGNTMSTAVVERTVEIGTLRAIGLRRGGIRRLFVVEGLLLGIFGALFGVVCALTVSLLINRLGLTWLPPGGAEPLPLILRVWGEMWLIVGTTTGLICIAVLSAWWPAYRAAKLNVVDALRHA